MPYALEVVVAVGAWLMRWTVGWFGGASFVARAVLRMASLVRWLHARWAARQLVRSKATVSHGEVLWVRARAPRVRVRLAATHGEVLQGHGLACRDRVAASLTLTRTLTLTLTQTPTLTLTLTLTLTQP